MGTLAPALVGIHTVVDCATSRPEESGLNYTTFRLCGFMQAIIGNYALPILEERPVWGTTDMTRTAYIDSGDAARLALAAVDREETFGKTLDLSGPRPLAVPEIIAL